MLSLTMNNEKADKQTEKIHDKMMKMFCMKLYIKPS